MRVLAAFVLLSVCAPSAHAGRHKTTKPKPPVTAAGAPDSAEIKGGNQILVHDTNGKARKALVANAHEGFADLSLSPDRYWATAMVTYPYDVLGADTVQNYRIIVHLPSGVRLDLEDFPKHFGVPCKVKDFSWKAGKTATLGVTCVDGGTADVDMPNAGVPPLPAV